MYIPKRKTQKKIRDQFPHVPLMKMPRGVQKFGNKRSEKEAINLGLPTSRLLGRNLHLCFFVPTYLSYFMG